MSYDPLTDFMALLRSTNGGLRFERMPGLDYTVYALARAGMITLAVSAVAPTVNQAATAWFRPATPSWAAEGTLFLWNADAANYEPATPALWSALFTAFLLAPVTQDITEPGPANVSAAANVVRVNQTVDALITLIVPLSSAKIGSVLISDWKGNAGTYRIRVQLSGADVFPGGFTFWDIGSDCGSIFLRPVPGGYAI